MAPSDSHPDATLLIHAASNGDREAADRLLQLLYDELRVLAEARLARERTAQTLQPTALVHEAYLRVIGPEGESQRWDGRGHFFAAAAEAMRRVLVDRARARGSAKRGGGARRLALEPGLISVDEVPDGLLDLDEALEKFAAESPEKAELVKLRFFAGLTLAQAAEAMGISVSTADRYWAYARAWLYDALGDEKKSEKG